MEVRLSRSQLAAAPTVSCAGTTPKRWLSILSGADFLIAVKHSRRSGFRLIRDRLTDGLRIPWRTSGREVKRGRDISLTLRARPAPEWVMEQWPGSATFIAVRSQGLRDGKPTDETRDYVWSLRTGAQALLRHVRNRWSIENSWHWVLDVALREDATAIGRTTESRSWPRSAAWRSMPCGSIGDAKTAALLAVVQPSRLRCDRPSARSDIHLAQEALNGWEWMAGY
ncbi:MAG: hypothetical protein ACK5N0_09280 [Synechococcaceae cyanobacterium]